jgi:hypothetical protein
MASRALDKIYSIIQDRVKKGYDYRGTNAYNVSMSDLKKMQNISDKYGFPVEWLANLINHESAGTWAGGFSRSPSRAGRTTGRTVFMDGGRSPGQVTSRSRPAPRHARCKLARAAIYHRSDRVTRAGRAAR